MKCKHENKVYGPHGECLCSFPSYHVSHWICKDCGYEGTDTEINKAEERMAKQLFEYEATKNSFKKEAEK